MTLLPSSIVMEDAYTYTPPPAELALLFCSTAPAFNVRLAPLFTRTSWLHSLTVPPLPSNTILDNDRSTFEVLTAKKFPLKPSPRVMVKGPPSEHMATVLPTVITLSAVSSLSTRISAAPSTSSTSLFSSSQVPTVTEFPPLPSGVVSTVSSANAVTVNALITRHRVKVRTSHRLRFLSLIIFIPPAFTIRTALSVNTYAGFAGGAYYAV